MWSGLPQHVGDDEKANMRTTNIHLVEMADAAVARRHSDILELHVHVVLSLDELAAEHLAGGELERADVTLGEHTRG